LGVSGVSFSALLADRVGVFRFHAESSHGDLSPMLGGVVPPSSSRARLPDGGGDIQATPVRLVH